MPINIRDLTSAEAKIIKTLSEGHFADAKALEVTPAKLSRSVSSFANADGGELFVGLREDKVSGTFDWKGFANEEAANGHIQLFEKLFPLGAGFDYELLRAARSAGLVLHIEIAKSPVIVRSSDGIPYLRRGAQNLPVSSEIALKQLERDKGLSSYENEVVATNVETVTQSNVTQEFIKQVVPLRRC
jgi:ATP-dependent DNA helicase RecG